MWDLILYHLLIVGFDCAFIEVETNPSIASKVAWDWACVEEVAGSCLITLTSEAVLKRGGKWKRNRLAESTRRGNKCCWFFRHKCFPRELFARWRALPPASADHIKSRAEFPRLTALRVRSFLSAK